jgi:Protein of unknown function (DUF1570)
MWHPTRQNQRLLWRTVGVLLGGLLLSVGLAAAEPNAKLEKFRWQDAANTVQETEGRVVTEAEDGGLLVLGRDGRLWTIDKPQLQSRTDMAEPFRPHTPAAMADLLQQEFGKRFEIVRTKHYVICSSSPKKYAQWCGNLFERLYLGFHNHWKQRGLKLVEPEFPLIALVFASEKEFATFARRDAGEDAATAKGYYSIVSNRIVLYDLTADDATPIGDASEIDKQVAAVPYNIATIVHEATHQIAFNSGMHTRLADNPLWLAEGMAMYFETPDLGNKNGWKSAGAVNYERLERFQELLASGRRPPDSLETLIASDARLQDAAQMDEAYAESWALTFYLIRYRKKEYVDYLGKLAEKPPLVSDSREERLAEFRAAFGDDLKKLDADFLKAIRKLK